MIFKHEFKPIYDENSKILILGTFPSVKSREQGFYYGHPRNRFWSVLADIFNESIPCTIDEKTNFLLSHNIALWDVIQSCDIVGSSDSSIKKVIPNDIASIINDSNIDLVILNGKKAKELFDKYINDVNIITECLPSTSPANASWSYEKLLKEWGRHFNSLQKD